MNHIVQSVIILGSIIYVEKLQQSVTPCNSIHKSVIVLLIKREGTRIVKYNNSLMKSSSGQPQYLKSLETYKQNT